MGFRTEEEDAEAAIIDVDPFDESIFREIDARTRLPVRIGVGYDAVDLAAASRHGIAVARTPGANSSGVAELALTLGLAVKRRIVNHQVQLVEQAKELNVRFTSLEHLFESSDIISLHLPYNSSTDKIVDKDMSLRTIRWLVLIMSCLHHISPATLTNPFGVYTRWH